MTLRDLLTFLFKWKGTIFGTLGVCVLLVTFLSYAGARSYSASATVLIERTAAIPSRQIYSPNQDMIEVLNSEVAIIKSRPVMEAVIDRLRPHERRRSPGVVGSIISGIQSGMAAIGLIDRLPPREQWIQTLIRQVKAKPAVESSVVTIDYGNEDPVLARDIVNAVTDEYLRRHEAIFSVSGLSGVYLTRMRDAEAKLAQLRGARAGLERATVTDPARQTALLDEVNANRGSLAAKRGELLDLSTRFSPGHPKVRAAEAQVADLQRLIAAGEARLASLQAASPRADSLAAEITSEEQTLRNMRNSYDDALVTEHADPRLVSVRLVSEAALPQKPSPSRLLLILIGFVAGLVLGLLFAVIRAYFDQRPDNVAEVERLIGLPGFGSVPDLPAAVLPNTG